MHSGIAIGASAPFSGSFVTTQSIQYIPITAIVSGLTALCHNKDAQSQRGPSPSYWNHSKPTVVEFRYVPTIGLFHTKQSTVTKVMTSNHYTWSIVKDCCFISANSTTLLCG